MESNYDFMLSRKLYYIGIGILAIAVALGIILKLAGIPLAKLNPYPCALHAIYGYYCPGCGGTRATIALLHGHFLKSVYYHPVVLYAAILFACYICSHSLNIFTHGKIKAMLFRPVYFYIMIVIIIVQCIVKNAFIIFAGIYLLG